MDELDGTLRRGASGRARGKSSAEGTHEERKNHVNVAIQPAQQWRSRCVDVGKVNGCVRQA